MSSAAHDAHGNEGQTLATAGSFTDPDGDPLALTASSSVGTFVGHPDGAWGVAGHERRRRAGDDHGDRQRRPGAHRERYVHVLGDERRAGRHARSSNRLVVDEGFDQAVFVYAVSDAGGGDTIASVDTSCGANGTKVTGSDTHDADGGSFRCVFRDGPATSTVSVRVTDDNGGVSAISQQTVTVRNVAPRATLNGANGLTVDEGTGAADILLLGGRSGRRHRGVGGTCRAGRPARWWPGRRRRRASGASSPTAGVLDGVGHGDRFRRRARLRCAGRDGAQRGADGDAGPRGTTARSTRGRRGARTRSR